MPLRACCSRSRTVLELGTVLQREQCHSTVLEVGPEGRTSRGHESSHKRLAAGAIAALLWLRPCWYLRHTQVEARLGGPTVEGRGPVDAVVAGAGRSASEGARPQHCVEGRARGPHQPCAPEGARPQHCVGGGARGPNQLCLREQQPYETCCGYHCCIAAVDVMLALAPYPAGREAGLARCSGWGSCRCSGCWCWALCSKGSKAAALCWRWGQKAAPAMAARAAALGDLLWVPLLHCCGCCHAGTCAIPKWG